MSPLSRVNLPQQSVAAAQPVQPAGAARFADNDLRDILFACHAQQAAHKIFVGRRNDFRAAVRAPW